VEEVEKGKTKGRRKWKKGKTKASRKGGKSR